MKKRTVKLAAAVLAALALSACGTESASTSGASAPSSDQMFKASLKSIDGANKDAGKATVTVSGAHVSVAVDAAGMNGLHMATIHNADSCSDVRGVDADNAIAVNFGTAAAVDSATGISELPAAGQIVSGRSVIVVHKGTSDLDAKPVLCGRLETMGLDSKDQSQDQKQAEQEQKEQEQKDQEQDQEQEQKEQEQKDQEQEQKQEDIKQEDVKDEKDVSQDKKVDNGNQTGSGQNNGGQCTGAQCNGGQNGTGTNSGTGTGV